VATRSYKFIQTAIKGVISIGTRRGEKRQGWVPRTGGRYIDATAIGGFRTKMEKSTGWGPNLKAFTTACYANSVSLHLSWKIEKIIQYVGVSGLTAASEITLFTDDKII
jgi:hypothetical protein